MTMPEPGAPGPDERFEHIPWEHLSPARDRHRLIYLIAAVVVLAAAGAALVLSPTGSAPPTATPPAATDEGMATPTSGQGLETPSTIPAPSAPPTASTEPRIWSEADLMAVAPGDLAAEASRMAEWLASDFFTLDGGSEIPAELAGILPVGSEMPRADAGWLSFVEWCRAVAVSEIAPGTYRVAVVVRRLGAAAGEPYSRLPALAVEIDLTWTPQGWSVLDLPAVADTPLWHPGPAWESQDVPEAVAAATVALGAEVISGSRAGDLWRVVAAFPDPVGAMWPLVVWFDAEGNPVDRTP